MNTKVNKHTLSRQAWPQSNSKIYCTINGVDMISCEGYHAAVQTPQYAYINKMQTRGSSAPDNRATVDFELGDSVVITDHDDQFYTLSNGTKLSKVFADYYQNEYPGATWHNAGRMQPIGIKQSDKLVAVIMPVRA